jgi:hypothetical protein
MLVPKEGGIESLRRGVLAARMARNPTPGVVGQDSQALELGRPPKLGRPLLARVYAPPTAPF